MATSWRRPLLAALLAASTAVVLISNSAFAQPAATPPVAAVDPSSGSIGGPAAPGGNTAHPAPAGGGAAANADFDSLIDLITSTVDKDSWQENGTGEGEIQPFPNGVYIDASGALCVASMPHADLAAARAHGTQKASASKNFSAMAGASNQPSAMRYVSLPRLEQAIAARQAAHLPLTADMLTLAGLQRITHVFVYPETHDLVLAGPAGDWQSVGPRLVSTASQQPVVRLDDLIALLRRQRSERSAAFGCSIVPRQDALARTQQYVTATGGEPIDSTNRGEWLEGLRQSVGVQDVEYYNIDPDTRVARLLLEADYHMKLVGMGLARGVPGVKSYLASVRLGPGGSVPPMTVLRWWFSMPQSIVTSTPEHDAFALPARCVEVLSENELLAARGKQVHTGQSEDLNRQFAESFTAAFDQLAVKYPVYGELARVFETALALAVIEREGLAEKAGWSPGLLVDEQRLKLPATPAPRSVETVVNHRVIGGRQIIAGVSGGVWVDGSKRLAVETAGGESQKVLAKTRRTVSSTNGAAAWWWD